MKVVRKSVFETNSSSSHSISIVGGDYVPDKLYIDEAGICEIHPGGYGWEVEDYDDAATKASYCLTWAKASNDEQLEEMLRNVIKLATGANEVNFVPMEAISSYHAPWGYIDHQSGPGEEGSLCEAWDSEQSLRDFIFNRKSVLHTDNDNH